LRRDLRADLAPQPSLGSYPTVSEPGRTGNPILAAAAAAGKQAVTSR
jgi:hypothetical protein